MKAVVYIRIVAITPKTKKGKFTAQPQYPCFGQDLGDSAGAGNLPLQRYEKIILLQMVLEKRQTLLYSCVYFLAWLGRFLVKKNDN